MNDYLLFVDTETSGIPQELDAKITDDSTWPYVLQLAWHIYTKSGELIKKENHYIYDPAVEIEKSSFKVHGISLGDLKEKGEDRKHVIRKFNDDLRQYKPLIIGHFIKFDSKMLQVVMHRSGLKNHLKEFPHFCTMHATTAYKRMPNHEYPLLGELYERLFKKKMIGEHDANIDVEVTAACYFELIRKGDLNEKMIEDQQYYQKVNTETKSKSGCGLSVLMFSFLALFSILLWML